jgi:hypothetical protein
MYAMKAEVKEGWRRLHNEKIKVLRLILLERLRKGEVGTSYVRE